MKYAVFIFSFLIFITLLSIVVSPFLFSAIFSDVKGEEVDERCGEINLKWDPVERAGSYALYRNGDVIYRGGSLRYKDKPLIQENIHEYSLMAVNKGGRSDISEEANLTVERPCPPEEPMEVEVHDMPCGGSVSFEWDPVPRADVYEVTRRPAPIITGTISEWAEGPSTLQVSDKTEFSEEGLTPGALYSYRVRGGNETDMGNWYRKFIRASQICPPERPDPPERDFSTW
ncbi:MAG: hypothetical protein ACQESA_01180 [Patescibacteria group bacterium]